jgi:hypothetical protein
MALQFTGRFPTEKDIKSAKIFSRYDRIDKKNTVSKLGRAINGPKGIEKIILSTIKGAKKFEGGVYDVIYGKDVDDNATAIKKITNYGIDNILDLLLEVDICNLLNEVSSRNYNNKKNKDAKQFDPTKNPKDEDPNASFATQSIWRIKKLAYDIQTIIESTPDGLNKSEEQRKADIFNTISSINNAYVEIKQLVSPELMGNNLTAGDNSFASKTDILNQKISNVGNRVALASGVLDTLSLTKNKDSLKIKDALPILNSLLPSIEDKLGYLNQWNDAREIPISEIKRITDILVKIKSVCIAIQSAQSVYDVLSIASDGNIQKTIKKLESLLIKPTEIAKSITNINKELFKINLLLKNILSIIGLARTITTVLLLIIKVFKKIIIFFQINPAPNLYTWLGLTTTVSKGERKISDGVGTFEERLEQLNYLFNVLYGVASTLTIEINILIAKVRSLILNLEACGNVDKTLISDLTAQADEIEASVGLLDKFVKQKNIASENSARKIEGEYTISIVTEEVIEEAFTLRRRYGIAIDKRGIAVLSSTPTFASSDAIIIAEVKHLLASKGLIKSNFSDYTILEEELLSDVISFLGDDDISMDLNYGEYSIPQSDQIDSPNNEDENSGIGLNAFLNKLQGGKKLRKKVKEAKIAHNQSLVSTLQKDDPNQKYTSGIVKSTNSQTNKLKSE